MNSLLALIVSTVSGACILRLLLGPCHGLGRAIERTGLAIALGLGLASELSFLRVVLAPDAPFGGLASELALIAVGAAACAGVAATRKTGHREFPPSAPSGEPATDPPGVGRMLAAGPLVVLAVLVVAWMMRGLATPFGNWDAWAVWNQRARFLFLGGSHWVNHFDQALSGWAHPDYPMLLPLSVYRLWTYEGSASMSAGVVLAAAFSVATALIVFGSVRTQRGPIVGTVAVLSLLGLPVFLEHTTFQIADIPVGLFMLASLALLMDALASRHRGSDPSAHGPLGMWLVAGFFAGCAAWTKREGLLFLLAVLVAALVTLRPRRSSWRPLATFVAGAIPMLATLLYFKTSYHPAGNIKSIAFNWGHLFDLNRHTAIWSRSWVTLGNETLTLLPVLAAMLLCLFAFGLDRDRLRRPMAMAGFITISVMVAGYYAAFLFTPYRLEWMVDLSISRLLLQIWPMIVLVFCALLRTPTPAVAVARSPGEGASASP